MAGIERLQHEACSACSLVHCGGCRQYGTYDKDPQKEHLRLKFNRLVNSPDRVLTKDEAQELKTDTMPTVSDTDAEIGDATQQGIEIAARILLGEAAKANERKQEPIPLEDLFNLEKNPTLESFYKTMEEMHSRGQRVIIESVGNMKVQRYVAKVDQFSDVRQQPVEKTIGEVLDSLRKADAAVTPFLLTHPRALIAKHLRAHLREGRIMAPTLDALEQAKANGNMHGVYNFAEHFINLFEKGEGPKA